MTNKVPNISIPLALSKKNEFKFQQDTISTAKFMDPQPDTYLWTIPFQDVKIQLDSFTRCSPLNLPTFGRIKVAHRAFFVKFKDIFEGWNDAYTRNLHIFPHEAGSNTYNVSANTTTPFFTAAHLIHLFENDSTIAILANSATDPKDFWIADTSQTPSTSDAYYLTAKGRNFYKILLGLGYTLIGDKATNIEYCALPLLAYCKIMAENYFPSNWKNNTIYTDMISILNFAKVYSSTLPNQLDYDDLGKIATFLQYCNGYEQDYFVSSYLNNVQSNNNPFASQSISTDSVVATVETNNTVSPRIRTSGSSSTYGFISQNVVDTLQRITAYLKINSLAGADAFNRIYAMFGYNTESDRAIHFGSDEYILQIGDIQSTADTQSSNGGASIGSYAGKGVGGSANRTFEFHCPVDCGIIIIVKTITPKTGYTQGFDRHNLQTNILDFWHPLTDSLGDQAISKGELYSLPYGNSALNTANNIEGEFSKIPRFAHYKVGHDLCIGDFTILSRNTGMNAWHLFRDFNFRLTPISNTLDFASGEDAIQFLRIFQNNGNKDTYEPFNCVSNYNIVSYAPMRKLWDDTCLDQLEHQDNGKTDGFKPGGVEFS